MEVNKYEEEVVIVQINRHDDRLAEMLLDPNCLSRYKVWKGLEEQIQIFFQERIELNTLKISVFSQFIEIPPARSTESSTVTLVFFDKEKLKVRELVIHLSIFAWHGYVFTASIKADKTIFRLSGVDKTTYLPNIIGKTYTDLRKRIIENQIKLFMAAINVAVTREFFV